MNWSQWPGLNRRPTVYETVALPLSYIGLNCLQMPLALHFARVPAARTTIAFRYDRQSDEISVKQGVQTQTAQTTGYLYLGTSHRSRRLRWSSAVLLRHWCCNCLFRSQFKSYRGRCFYKHSVNPLASGVKRKGFCGSVGVLDRARSV